MQVCLKVENFIKSRKLKMILFVYMKCFFNLCAVNLLNQKTFV